MSCSMRCRISGRCSVSETPPVGGFRRTCIVCGENRWIRLATCASCSSTSNARFTTCPSQNTSPRSPFSLSPPAAPATSPHPRLSKTSICWPGSARSRPSFSTSDEGLLYPLNAPSMNTCRGVEEPTLPARERRFGLAGGGAGGESSFAAAVSGFPSAAASVSASRAIFFAAVFVAPRRFGLAEGPVSRVSAPPPSPLPRFLRTNGGNTVGADDVAMPASHWRQPSFWSRPLFGCLYVRTKRTSKRSVCSVATTKHRASCPGASSMGRSPRYSRSNSRIAVLSAALPLSSRRIALCDPNTSRPMSRYIFSSSRRGTPRARPSAMIPPVLTPPIRSKSSWIGRPAARSRARSCQISARPLMPPPSRDRRRKPRGFAGAAAGDASSSSAPRVSLAAAVAAAAADAPSPPPRCLRPYSARRARRSNTRCTERRHRISFSTSETASDAAAAGAPSGPRSEGCAASHL